MRDSGTTSCWCSVRRGPSWAAPRCGRCCTAPCVASPRGSTWRPSGASSTSLWRPPSRGGGLVRSAHDCSHGGLGVALAEIAMGGAYEQAGFGLDVDLTSYALRLTPYDVLFSESHGRAVVTCAPERAAAVTALAQEHGVPIHRAAAVGERGGRVRLRLRDAVIDRPVGELREVYFTAIPRRLGD